MRLIGQCFGADRTEYFRLLIIPEPYLLNGKGGARQDYAKQFVQPPLYAVSRSPRVPSRVCSWTKNWRAKTLD